MELVRVKVAETFDELITAMSIRDMVFIAEQGSSFEMERDGNDIAGTHIIAFVGSSPAAAMRIRWFSDGAMFEHLAVRKEFRRVGVAKTIAKSAIQLAKTKGFKRVSGYPVREMVSFWEKFGWTETPSAASINIFGTVCYPMSGEVRGTNEIVSIYSDHEAVICAENKYCQDPLFA
jgi:GNAT superfamily N-acetyltransferase